MNNENSKNLGNGYKQFADIMCQGRDTMWRVLIGYYKHQFYKFQFVVLLRHIFVEAILEHKATGRE